IITSFFHPMISTGKFTNPSRKGLLNMPGPRHMRHGAKPENVGKTIKRILLYMNEYKIHLVLVFLFVLLSSGASIAGTYFLKPLINDYILPFVGKQNPDLSAFLRLILSLALIYAAGVLSTYGYNRLMLTISTGTLYKLRTD